MNSVDRTLWASDFWEPMPESWPLWKARNKLDITIFSKRLVVCGRICHLSTDIPSRINNLDQMSDVLSRQSQFSKYLLFNFGTPDDSLYDPVHFNNQVCRFITHKALMPTLDTIFQAVLAMSGWLDLLPTNIVVVHCRNGLGRSGIIVACFLRFWGLFESTYDAFDRFLAIRCSNSKKHETLWANSTLRRYLRYFNDCVTLKGMVPNHATLQIHQVIINTVPDFDGHGSCQAEAEVYCNGELAFSSIIKTKELENSTEQIHDDDDVSWCDPQTTLEDDNLAIGVHRPNDTTIKFQDDQMIIFWLDAVQVNKDVVVRVLNKSQGNLAGTTIFAFAFNTGFVNSGILRVQAEDMVLPLWNVPAPGYTNSRSRFMSNFSADFIMTNVAQTVFETYTVYFNSDSTKILTELTRHHSISPMASAISALELLPGPAEVKIAALQMFNNDLHSAHVYVLNCKNDQFSYGWDHPHRQFGAAKEACVETEVDGSCGLDDNMTLAKDLDTVEDVPPESIPNTMVYEHPLVSTSIPPPPPPPPPPPHACITHELDTDRLKMKSSLNWQAIPESSAPIGSIWVQEASLPTCVEQYIDTFEQLFCIDPKRPSDAADSISTAPSSQKSTCPSIVDIRRANNVEIGMSKLDRSLSISDMRERIYRKDLSIDDLLILKEIAPTPEEQSCMKIYRGAPESLIDPERFLLEMSKEPGFEWMIDCILLERTFDSDLGSSCEKIETICGLFQKLIESPSLKRILRTILDIGNLATYQYGRTRRRVKAAGFRLESLCHLKDTFGIDRSINLLHYLVIILRRNYPECLKISEEFPEISMAKELDVNVIIGTVSGLKSAVQRVKSFKRADQGHLKKFHDDMCKFVDHCENALVMADEVIAKYKEIWRSAVMYFGEKEDEVRPQDMLCYFDALFKGLDNVDVSSLHNLPVHVPILRPMDSLNSLTDEGHNSDFN